VRWRRAGQAIKLVNQLLVGVHTAPSPSGRAGAKLGADPRRSSI